MGGVHKYISNTLLRKFGHNGRSDTSAALLSLFVFIITGIRIFFVKLIIRSACALRNAAPQQGKHIRLQFLQSWPSLAQSPQTVTLESLLCRWEFQPQGGAFAQRHGTATTEHMLRRFKDFLPTTPARLQQQAAAGATLTETPLKF